MGRIRLALYLGAEGHKLGPGKIRLLEAVRETGSISAAARSMGMAYRHAWEMVDALNRCFTTPVVTASIGGREGGGAVLTEWGAELIEHFRAIEAATESAVGSEVARLEAKLAEHAESEKGQPKAARRKRPTR